MLVHTTRRVGGAVVGALALTALTACWTRDVAPLVPFPDDPRVLDGTWEIVLERQYRSVIRFVVTDDASTVALWTDPDPSGVLHTTARLHVATPDGTYAEADPESISTSGMTSTFDAHIAAFVLWSADGITVFPLDGTPAFEHTLSLPDGMTIEHRGAGSGRSFAIATDGSGEPVLYWWDTVSGAAEGDVVLPAHSYARFSKNGRTLLLWDIDGTRVHAVDTSNPVTHVSVSLGACEDVTPVDASRDGRWVAFRDDCGDDLSVVDLAAPTPAIEPLGLSIEPSMSFAADTAEFVTVDATGAVRALDMATRTSQLVLQLPDEDVERYGPGQVYVVLPVYLNRGAGILGYETSSRLVRLVGLGGNATDAVLPAPPFERATMELTATRWDASEGDRDWYDFSGTAGFTFGVYDVTGSVDGGSEQRYRPTGTSPAPLALPPRLRGEATFQSTTGPARSYALEFSTLGRPDIGYEGHLTGDQDDVRYEVSMRPVD